MGKVNFIKESNKVVHFNYNHEGVPPLSNVGL